MVASCTPWDRSVTVSFSGHRVWSTRRRRWTSLRRGSCMWKRRMAGSVGVADPRAAAAADWPTEGTREPAAAAAAAVAERERTPRRDGDGNVSGTVSSLGWGRWWRDETKPGSSGSPRAPVEDPGSAARAGPWPGPCPRADRYAAGSSRQGVDPRVLEMTWRL